MHQQDPIKTELETRKKKLEETLKLLNSDGVLKLYNLPIDVYKSIYAYIYMELTKELNYSETGLEEFSLWIDQIEQTGKTPIPSESLQEILKREKIEVINESES